MSYVKNTHGIVINTDDSYYRSIIAHRESQKQARELQGKLSSLESELIEIRDTLKQVLNRK